MNATKLMEQAHKTKWLITFDYPLIDIPDIQRELQEMLEVEHVFNIKPFDEKTVICETLREEV